MIRKLNSTSFKTHFSAKFAGANTPLAHLPKCTLFAPQNFAEALFSCSLGQLLYPAEMKTKVMQNLVGVGGGQTRCIMGDVQIENGLNTVGKRVSNFCLKQFEAVFFV